MRSRQIRLFSSHSPQTVKHSLEGKKGLQLCFEEQANQAIFFPFTLDTVQSVRKACRSVLRRKQIRLFACCPLNSIFLQTWCLHTQTRFSPRLNLVCFTAHFIHFGHKFEQKCLFTDSSHRPGSRFARTSSVSLEKILHLFQQYELQYRAPKNLHFLQRLASASLILCYYVFSLQQFLTMTVKDYECQTLMKNMVKFDVRL